MVDTKALNEDAPPPPKPKKEGDGYSHAQPEHIHVDHNSGSFGEALKEYYVEEARKEKEKYEAANAK